MLWLSLIFIENKAFGGYPQASVIQCRQSRVSWVTALIVGVPLYRVTQFVTPVAEC